MKGGMLSPAEYYLTLTKAYNKYPLAYSVYILRSETDLESASRELAMKVEHQDHRVLALWAANCAEHVLERFERHHPNDKRPRNAIEAARAWERGELAMADARKAAFASHAAAREAREPEAIAAARAAGHAAATAHVATHAPHASAYALKAVGRTEMAEAERIWQHECLPEHLPALKT